jgi:uncharacterized membrane protein YccC
MQSSVGGSVKATIDRAIGTIGGAVTGGAAAYLLPHESALSVGVALVIAFVPLTLPSPQYSRKTFYIEYLNRSHFPIP